MTEAIRIQFEQFKCGFFSICDSKALQLFNSFELKALALGNENINWDEWKQVI